ncbi:transcriptional regulator [Vibrio sp. B1FIG11]|uniref:TetR/AcrR family transcriptional regulator n=1 Tax=Vibrio sp. B1FIG11 TaxID=2751177 RepID=UPI001AF18E9F|nr:TetR/AcrR family transcriptional regulator [Vibrio sp. B1FIG11]CAE6950390.1 transcriptional regulator [Vibrio sp. B1FIG11]
MALSHWRLILRATYLAFTPISDDWVVRDIWVFKQYCLSIMITPKLPKTTGNFMARISKQEREQNQRTYDEYIFNLFVTEGWECVTLDRVSKGLGIRKSTLQGYYPDKYAFLNVLQGRVFPLIVGQLDFTSRIAFINAWSNLLVTNNVFQQAVKMLLITIVKNGGESRPRVQAPIRRLINELEKNVGHEEANSTIKECLGAALMLLAFPDSTEQLSV